MRQLRRLWVRTLGLFRRRHEDDFLLELESHLAMDIENGQRAGLTYAEARRQALVRLGLVEQTRQAYRHQFGLPWVESLLRDLRYSVRTLLKHPAITVIAIISIGLGIGANATIFSLVNRFVLRPLPVADPASLLAISTTHVGDRCCNQFPLPLFEDVRDQSRSFSSLAAYYDLIPASISGSSEPQRLWGQAVTPNFFAVLQLPMVLGRGFAASEQSANVVILGENLWRHRFNADPALIGRSISLSGHAFTVVGIAPAAFHSVDQILYAQFWVPLNDASQLAPSLPPVNSREYHWLSVIARVRAGVSRKQVQAELDTLADRYAKAYPATDKDNGFHIEQAGTLYPNMKSTVYLFLAALSVVVLLVLVIACANVANLLLAQAAARQREMAVCLALGATRGRLRRQMLVESLLLGLLGGLVGILLSYGATSGLSTFRVPAPIPLDLSIGVDWRVIAFTITLCTLSGLFLGMGPTWTASNPKLGSALKGEDALARPGLRIPLRNVLVVTQIAMSVVLLSITVLFLRSLQSAAAVDIGFRADGIYMLSVDPRVHGYSPDRTASFLAQLREKVRTLPGVLSAVSTDVPLLSGGVRSDGFTVVGQSSKDRTISSADLYMVSPGYFDAIGLPRLSGRDFSAEPKNEPPVAVVNKTFADRLFPSSNPIGQHVDGGGVVYEIIGVVKDSKSRTLGEATRPILYRYLDQTIAKDPSGMGYTLVVRMSGPPSAIAESVRRQVYALDRSMAIFNEETMQDHLRTAYFLPHLAATLFGVFGIIGLALTAIGLYGVMKYSVTRRTREIGIRMALGAHPGNVERLILRQGMTLFGIALAIGWPSAWGISKLAANFLYGIKPHDTLTFATVPIFLAVVAGLACWLPARRAASINPTDALRSE